MCLVPVAGGSTQAVQQGAGVRPARNKNEQFFIALRFDRKALEREAMAVDSEYKNTLQNDDCRLNHVMQSLAKPGHPYTNFKCGNHDSLYNLCKVQAGVKVTRLIMNFSSANYSKKSHEIFSLTLSTCCTSSTTTSTRRTWWRWSYLARRTWTSSRWWSSRVSHLCSTRTWRGVGSRTHSPKISWQRRCWLCPWRTCAPCVSPLLLQTWLSTTGCVTWCLIAD